ncbi:MAG: hypothetical protein QOF89_3591 [Acidobacteriota bacterium]|jgi:hypothetical protein|nr:hypothetical protein [Acidobacteriota bacterium]
MFREQRKLGRIVGAVALTTVLSLAGPAGAETPGRIGPARWLQWLDALSQGGIGELVRSWTAEAPRASNPVALRAKDTTPCIPTLTTSCPVNPPPDQGTSLDPDGKPKP